MKKLSYEEMEKKLNETLHLLKDIEKEKTSTDKDFFDNIIIPFFENIEFPVGIFDNHLHLFTNLPYQKIFGYSKEELFGIDFHEIIKESSIKVFEEFLQKGSKQIPSSLDYNLQGIKKNKEIFSFKISTSHIKIENKTFSVAFLLDISKRIQIYNELFLFKNSVESSSDAVGMSTPEGKHYYQNSAFTKLFGEIGEDPPSTLYVDERVGREVFETIMQGERWSGEVQMFSKDKKILDIFLRAYAFKDEQDRISGLVGIHNDITEKKHYEKSLIESEERFRTMVEFAPDGILIGDLEKEKFVMANTTICNMLGYTEEEILDLWISNIHPVEELPIVMEQLDMQIKGMIVKSIDLPVKRKDGSIFYAVISSRKIPFNNQNAVIGIFRDITVRKYEEEALKISEGLYRNMLDILPEGIVIHSKGKIVYANRAAYVIMKVDSKNELIGENVIDFVHPDYRLIAMERIRKSKDSQKPADTIEEVFIRKDGKAINVLVTAIPFQYMGLPSMFTVFTDITEKKKAEELNHKIQDAETKHQIQNAFMANLSHEIRNPLNAIIGMNQMLSRTGLNKEQEEYIKAINHSSNHLLSLLNDILDYSKIESGKTFINNEPFSLVDLLNEVNTIVGIKCKEKNLLYISDIEKEIPEWFISDATKIKQVVNNLLGNAIKFTEKGSISFTIKRLKTDKKEYWLEFEVKDTGIGIEEENFEKIFQSFTQIDSSESKKYQGAGLGLSISKKYIELLGGNISISSKLGFGTILVFSLPFQKYDEKGSLIKKEKKEQETKSENRRKLNILLAEDDAINRLYLTKFLQKHGWNVVPAINGKEAFEIYKTMKFDIILMDGQMPVMDGFEASLCIRKEESQSSVSVPIIAITGYSPLEKPEKFARAYIDDYILKPINENDLLRKISKLVNPEKK